MIIWEIKKIIKSKFFIISILLISVLYVVHKYKGITGDDEQNRSPKAEAVIPLAYDDVWNHVYKFNKNGELEELLMGY